MIVGNGRIKMNPRRVENLWEWLKPKTSTDVKSFMGLLKFFDRIIKKIQ